MINLLCTDNRLVRTHDQLPLHSLTPYIMWRRVAWVRYRGEGYAICLGFITEDDSLQVVGMLSRDGSKVYAVPSFKDGEIDLVRREQHTGADAIPGISISFLLEWLHFAEAEIVRRHNELTAEGRADQSPYNLLADRIVLPPGLADWQVLVLCAATATTDAFYRSTAFGGPDNMDELIAVVEYVRNELGDEVAEPVAELAHDLYRLDQVWPGAWTEAHYSRQRHIVTHLLALLRYIELTTLASRP